MLEPDPKLRPSASQVLGTYNLKNIYIIGVLLMFRISLSWNLKCVDNNMFLILDFYSQNRWLSVQLSMMFEHHYLIYFYSKLVVSGLSVFRLIIK